MTGCVAQSAFTGHTNNRQENLSRHWRQESVEPVSERRWLSINSRRLSDFPDIGHSLRHCDLLMAAPSVTIVTDPASEITKLFIMDELTR